MKLRSKLLIGFGLIVSGLLGAAAWLFAPTYLLQYHDDTWITSATNGVHFEKLHYASSEMTPTELKNLLDVMFRLLAQVHYKREPGSTRNQLQELRNERERQRREICRRCVELQNLLTQNLPSSEQAGSKEQFDERIRSAVAGSLKFPEKILPNTRDADDKFVAVCDPRLQSKYGFKFDFSQSYRALIRGVLPNSAALKSGLEAGEEILAIDDIALVGLSSDVVTAVVNSRLGKPLKLLITMVKALRVLRWKHPTMSLRIKMTCQLETNSWPRC